jgi:biotin-dependent carboxylase-like uncharacterized protein
MTLEVRVAGVSCLQDLGRRAGRYGLSLNGALDQYSARAGNIRVGSPATAALIEITALDFVCSVDVDVLIAVTGAPADLYVDGRPERQWDPVVVRAGSRVEVRRIRTGLRVYLAVHGGLDGPRLMGSVTPDLPIGFGRNLAGGDRFVLRTDFRPQAHPAFEPQLFVLGAERPRFAESWVIDVTEGPDLDQFPQVRTVLDGGVYAVLPESNHIGLRLAGRVPSRSSSAEVLSRGVPVGAVEAPPGEELIVLHRGRGVTAGYAIPAVVTTTSLDCLGQARPGQTVRLRWSTVEAAVERARVRTSALSRLADRVARAFGTVGVSVAPDLLTAQSPPH